MKKKILSVFLILLMATVSVSFLVFADDEPEPVIEPEELAETEEYEPVLIEDQLIPEATVSSAVEEIEQDIAMAPAVTSERSLPLLGSSGTDSWLSDWDYEIKPLYYYGDYIYLNQYIGSNPDVTIYGKGTVGGSQYPVCINVIYVDDSRSYITGLNCSDNIVNLTFESVDGTKVCSSRTDRLDDMFYGMENLETVHFGGNFQGDVAQASNMFEGCVKLRSVDIETLDFGYASIYYEMFKDCRSLENVTLNCNRGTNLSSLFSGCTSLREVSLTGVPGRQNNAGDMFYTSGLTKLKIKGTPSQEFKDNVFSKLKGWNRYIGTVKLKALIELEGMDIHDCMFSVEKEGEGSSSKVSVFNYASDGNRVEHTAFVCAPGSNTFTIEERYVSEMSGNMPVETISISETPNITCEDAVRSKTVNIILNTDGSLSVEE